MTMAAKNGQIAKQPRCVVGIDDLPDCLVSHIISFLPMVDVFRMSLVSRRWGDLWQYTPDLDFDTDTEKLGAHGVVPFAAFVDKMLSDYQGSAVRGFHLQIPIGILSSPSKVDRFVLFAMKHSVEKLTLRVSSRVPKSYHLRPNFFRLSTSLRSLTLVNCDMVSRYSCISFPSLITLSLVSVSLTNSMLKDVMLGSPLLEKLSIFDPLLCGKLVIMDSRAQLKSLSVRGSLGKIVDIYAPKLLYLECRSNKVHIGNLASLITARMEASLEKHQHIKLSYQYRKMVTQSLIGVSQAKELSLKGPFLQILGNQKKESLGITFFNVRSLELTTTRLGGIEILGLAKLLKKLNAIVSLKIIAEADPLAMHYAGGCKKIDQGECWKAFHDSLAILEQLGDVELRFTDTKWIWKNHRILEADKFIECRKDEIVLAKCALKSLKHLKRLTITTPRVIFLDRLKRDIICILKYMLSSYPKASPDVQIVIS